MKLNQANCVELNLTRDEGRIIRRFIDLLQNGAVLEEMGQDDIWQFLEYIVAEKDERSQPFTFTKWNNEECSVTVHFEEEN